MTIPAPSAITNPSRWASKGREAFSGSSLRVDNAFMLQKPASDKGVTAASEPPAIITSAMPILTVIAAMPMACPEVAQAVMVAKLGPLAPVKIATCPAAMSAIIIGMKRGETPRGPFCNKLVWFSSQVHAPADARPDADTDPIGILRGDSQFGILQSHKSRRRRQLHIPVHLAHFAGVSEGFWVKVVDFAGNL